ncbi:UNVERIFIED_CONTAM: hypothetical protein GTU68_059702 [Idotea baltica]|nr:hypothetical protein [Idotea baltica]
MRIVYMGAGEIGNKSLKWLIEESGHDVVGVFTQPDKKVGRKQLLTPPETKTIAEASGIPVFQPETLRKNEAVIQSLRDLDADLFVVMAYGQILPKAVIEAPKLACINLHASLLPRHRGASPIQAAIRDGDAETGITLMHIVPKLDAGDMIFKKTISILDSDTGGVLHDKLADLGPELLRDGLEKVGVDRTPQDESLVTYSGKLMREDGAIDWSQPATEIELLIRSYDPWPGTYTMLEGAKLKIYPKAGPGPETDHPAGEVFYTEAGDFAVACGHGSSLVFKKDGAAFQAEGRKRLMVGDFLRGNPIAAGASFTF